ncbi:MAG: glucosaminidase domain-containing protein [Bacteroidales bacterium]|nr:glucosaminidase domain-containing protein [Bacteroidales bacterium]
MKKVYTSIFLMLAVLLLASADPVYPPIQKYVEQWAPTAVREMYRSGVPASITLAQGILESRYGLSPLAANGNNHFGIKCHKDWTGKKQFHDDDEKGECFRVYDNADESFRDHSDFLRYRDRYKFLFEFETTDYKSWANGLKKAGYATDPGYPDKLIKYIEDYNLSKYDTMSLAEAERLLDAQETVGASAVQQTHDGENDRSLNKGNDRSQSAVEGPSKAEIKAERKAAKKAGKAARKARKHSSAEEDDELTGKIPDSPLSLEEPKKIDRNQLEEFKFSLTREAYSKNGVPFVTSMDGETYSSIASRYGLFLKELLKFNDLTAPQELAPGTVVYLQAKKSQSEKGLDKYIVDEDGQSLRDICQRFGVKMSSVCKMNGITPEYVLREGDTIVLRGKKKK